MESLLFAKKDSKWKARPEFLLMVNRQMKSKGEIKKSLKQIDRKLKSLRVKTNRAKPKLSSTDRGFTEKVKLRNQPEFQSSIKKRTVQSNCCLLFRKKIQIQ
jgi:hypothetical protein